MMDAKIFKTRIKRFEYRRANELIPHAKNFRGHSQEQRAVMSGILQEVGFAGAVLTREDDNGRLYTIDGHLRNELAEDDEVPVLVTDLTEQEADKVLATYDAIGGMADVDDDIFRDLVEEIEFDNRDLDRLVDEMIKESDDDSHQDDSGTDENDNSEIIEEMELKPLEHYDYIVVLARTRNDWNVLCGALGIHRVRKARSKRIGLGRAIEASKLLSIIDLKDGTEE